MEKSDIMNMEEIRNYDAFCKKLLANKYIIAYILKGFLKEYERYSIDEIITCIDNKIQIGEEEVYLNEIHTLNSEDTTLYEGKVTYDVLFHSKNPNSEDSVDLFINVEAQKDYYPGYSLKNRALVYASRMVSRQYPLYKNSNYDKLRKVVSIWICIEVPKELKNKVIHYTLKGEVIEDGKKIGKDDLDKEEIILVCLGENSNIDAIKMLELLLKMKKGFIEKIKELEANYEVKFSEREKQEASTMCNLGEGIFEKGIAQGRCEGIIQGEEEKEKAMILTMSESLSIQEIARILKMKIEDIEKILK